MSDPESAKSELDSSTLAYWQRFVKERPGGGSTVQHNASSPFDAGRCHNTILHLVVLGFYSLPDPAAVASLLLAHGADPNIQNDKGETPLHLACQVPSRDPETVSILLKHGADRNLQTKKGKRPVALLGPYDRYSDEIRAMLAQ